MIGVVSLAAARGERCSTTNLVLVAGGYTESNVIDAMKFVFGKKESKQAVIMHDYTCGPVRVGTHFGQSLLQAC
ncbi:hypothetical protein HanXRQr2_Chr06g0242831 [Helianthus annuus]|uniref:Uncharacterized protein n=1 Tax=Helianthus annuus TaxID=4232 RepID=A0A9K3IQ80_HELAN|nr:hypothetical protein HanXRQr2_Chr06g0242831 [Helianthus annuus]